jgi:2-amino-4-hydroxy-6-hydroxymethyldihydropteridine diphosphokinase
MSTAYVGLGANLGDRAGSLRWALERLGSIGTVTAVSPVYETEPLDYLDQPPFLNAVAAVSTNLRPGSVLAALLAIELDAGRQRSIRHGPRTLDLDLLLYDDLEMSTPDLTLPHPRMHQRAFVLVPLADLAPDLAVPGTGATVGDLLRRVESLSGVHLYEHDAGTNEGRRPVVS